MYSVLVVLTVTQLSHFAALSSSPTHLGFDIPVIGVGTSEMFVTFSAKFALRICKIARLS